MSATIPPVHTIDERGWKTYDIQSLSAEQAADVAASCVKEAWVARIKLRLLSSLSIWCPIVGAKLVLKSRRISQLALAALAFVAECARRAHLPIVRRCLLIIFPLCLFASKLIVSKGGQALARPYLWISVKIAVLQGYIDHLDQLTREAYFQQRKGCV